MIALYNQVSHVVPVYTHVFIQGGCGSIYILGVYVHVHIFFYQNHKSLNFFFKLILKN